MDSKYLYKKEIEIPLYRGILIIILTNDKEKILKYLPDFKEERVYAHCWLKEWHNKQGYVIVLNFDNDFRKINNGTISHEALHACHFIADYVGIRPDFDNDEVLAYLIDWITDEIYKMLKKYNFKCGTK